VITGYIKHFDVWENDLELMNVPPGRMESVAMFHGEYFRAICRERECSYTKNHPGVVLDNSFFEELVERVKDTEHLRFLGGFFEFIQRCREKMKV
jgi:hypothetical protein